MRKKIEEQRKLGQVDISKIEIDHRCRDEIPRILIGLQHIYQDQEIREKVFAILKELIPANIDPNKGRPGMDLWKILVLGCVKLISNCDYDKLHDIANNHKNIREMLGHGDCVMENEADSQYSLQTLKDNVSLFTLEILERINMIVVECGHRFVVGKKKEEFPLNGKCDSFVVETDVHYPTDINLLFDAMRKTITLISRVCAGSDIMGWRNSSANIKKLKKRFRKAQKLKHSNSKDKVRKAQREEMIKEAHLSYISLSRSYLERTEKSLYEVKMKGSFLGGKIAEIKGYINHAYRQIDQIHRRVIEGESISHDEKVFSIFEENTEWISKGKAGVPQELGLKVCILEDQYGFILHHRVMEKETDDKAAVPMVVEAKGKYRNLRSCSFDKGFYSPGNKNDLGQLLELVILPKKGKLSKSDKQIECCEEFMVGRRKHSSVESAINRLENHGLDRCLDHGINGFKRYVGLAVLAGNIEKLGSLIRKRELVNLKRKNNRKKQKLARSGVDLEKLKVA